MGAIKIGVTLIGRSVCRSVGLWTFLVNTISQQPFVRIQYNFTRMIDTKPSCAYCQRVALGLFLNELFLVQLQFIEVFHILMLF